LAGSRYERIIEKVFFDHYVAGSDRVPFGREELDTAADALGIERVNNPPDMIYSFRYRVALPDAVLATADPDHTWVIRGEGKGRYAFAHVRDFRLAPHPDLVATKIPDATPGVVEMYALTDEQALLAKLRYNRLIDVFTGLVCYSLQNHLRTTVDGSQIEADEVYIDLDSHGVHYVLPVEAKGGSESLGRIQFEQGLDLCREKFPLLVPRLIGSQFTSGGLIALFELEETEEGFGIVVERHYRLVAPEELSDDELRQYRRRLG